MTTKRKLKQTVCEMREAIEREVEANQIKEKQIAHLEEELSYRNSHDGQVAALQTLEQAKKIADNSFGKEYWLAVEENGQKTTKKVYLNESISFSYRDLPHSKATAMSIKCDGVWYPEYLLHKTEAAALAWHIMNILHDQKGKHTSIKFSPALIDAMNIAANLEYF